MARERWGKCAAAAWSAVAMAAIAGGFGGCAAAPEQAASQEFRAGPLAMGLVLPGPMMQELALRQGGESPYTEPGDWAWARNNEHLGNLDGIAYRQHDSSVTYLRDSQWIVHGRPFDHFNIRRRAVQWRRDP